jgi:hypothetical protein
VFLSVGRNRSANGSRSTAPSSDAQQRIAEIERKQKTIRERLDRLDEAFLYERSIDIDTYDRHRDKLREELTIAQMDRHASELEEMDVEGILAFAERVLPSASKPLGPVVARSKAAAPAAVLSGGSALRREEDCWNRDNAPGFQLLKLGFGAEKRIGGPDRDRAGKASRRRCRSA